MTPLKGSTYSVSYFSTHFKGCQITKKKCQKVTNQFTKTATLEKFGKRKITPPLNYGVKIKPFTKLTGLISIWCLVTKFSFSHFQASISKYRIS